MKLSKTRSITGCMSLAFLFSGLAMSADQPVKGMANFEDSSAANQWISVNDTVMGGISKGGMRITDQKTLQFSGNIALENNGGFASIRTKPADLSMAGLDTVALRVKGDGRMYWVDLRTTSAFPAASYRAKMETEKDKWIEVRIPLKTFEFSAFGQSLSWVGAISSAQVQSVGFTLYDKKAGPFQLEVAWIRGENSAALEPCPTPEAEAQVP